jgi:rhodanese-related sulfurtransferase
MAAEELTKQGFDAISIEGGYRAWKDNEKKEAEGEKRGS